MKVFSKILLSIIAVLVVGFAAQQLLLNKILRVQSINVSFQEDNKSDKLFKKLKMDLMSRLKEWKGVSLLEVDLSDLIEDLQEDSRVKEVYIRRRFPRTLDVIVTARKYEVLLLTGRNLFRPVSHDASLLPALEPSLTPSLPVLRGKNFLRNQKQRKKALSLIRALPANGTFSRQSVSEIHYTKKNGYVLFLTHTGAKVKMGFDDFQKKSKHVQQVVKYLESEDLKGRVIDARFAKKVVVQLRK